jgi:hypothetical protein
VSPDPTAFPFGALGPTPDPGPQAVGAFVAGPPDSPRQVVRWLDQYRDHHELAGHVDPGAEAYLSLYSYPPADYVRHFVRAGYTPRGYAGPAACRHLLFDIDRAGDLDAALADARTVYRFLARRYGPKIDGGLAAYWSGGKGLHIALELLPAFAPAAAVPATCKRVALALAAAAGVRIDTGCFDHQRLVRQPNSQHPSGLFKRYITADELFALDVAAVRELARHPAGFSVPSCGEFIQELQDDWDRAAADAPAQRAHRPAGEHPVIPQFVRDFIGFADVMDPGRAVTLFRCAASLAQGGTPDAVTFGLLEEPALKTGLDPAEVRRQITTGIAHGRQAGGEPA